MDYHLAMEALQEAEPHLDERQYEALWEIVAMFRPYDGDDPEEARKRTPMTCSCRNCGYETAAMFVPSPVIRCAPTGIRLSQCPRCYSTNMVIGRA